ncbi:class II fructose-bisphosphate aldolase [Sporanaerobacter sp. PP17-6a]|uniref:class II fructose-bisphosphate aldolase n=1 Tax=Sporanaerobacter sp. PP17-6a TaxID=1891289 RepID=UPI0008A03BE6|nr:class II fructose-bisphosphate aldolase [Sporanaerobacter sp. PP17-6a]SCL90397.1 Fructose-bisphosphate aldolase [Sporanaerobacter sp. PP17-6a]
MLLPMSDILNKAEKEGYGVVAADVFNVDTVLGIFQVADELKSPVIINCPPRYDLELIAQAIKFYSLRYPEVVVASNLDHGLKFETAVEALKYGFTSIMVDRSQLPFEENIKETAEIAKIAHAVGVSVEAELGHVGKGVSYDIDRDAGLTRVEEAVEYINRTSVDCLAVAIGTAHGRYTGVPKIDFDRLVSIKEKVSIPLVLHGGSSTGDDNLKKAVKLGITKVNIFTDLLIEGAKYIKDHIEKEKSSTMESIYKEGMTGYKNMLKHYMYLFESVNRI